MMNQLLIQNCYKNEYGINLKKHHYEICKISDTEEKLIKDLNQSRIFFKDGISSNFKLIIYDSLVYLLGDKTCYPCSNVIESAYGNELNWVSCVLMPGEIKFLGETDIRKSGIIVSLFSQIIPGIPDETHFYRFIDRLVYSFSDCEWFKSIYSKSSYVKLVRFWDYKQKIKKLYELGLLYPLEFTVYTIYKQISIKNERVLKYFTYSLAESTNKIFNANEISDAFKCLGIEQIEDVLAIKNVRENIKLDLIDDNYFADLLEIDGNKRYPTFIGDVYYLYHMRNQADLIFKTAAYKKVYLKTLKQNFRALENDIRKKKGYEVVGSFFMEKFLFEKLSTEFPKLNMQTQYSPYWLQPQRLDIFIEECSLGIEYQGAQHFLPIDFFGGEEGLKLRKILDRRKAEKCFENSVDLIEISYEEDFEYAFTQLKLHISNLLSY